jgi:hypothetical protein
MRWRVCQVTPTLTASELSFDMLGTGGMLGSFLYGASPCGG